LFQDKESDSRFGGAKEMNEKYKKVNFDIMRELLLLLCQYPFREENREPLMNQLGKVSDWRKLVGLINSHGIIALAAYNIKESGLVNEVPPDAMASLENGYKQSMVRNLWLAERWKEVNKILSDAGIKHVLLKGMALEHTLYGSKGLRQMNDNDILVKRDEAIKAWELLQKNGYLPGISKSAIHRKIMMNIGKHLPSLYKNGYAIEIHHDLFKNDSSDDAVDKAVEISIGDTKAWILSKDLQLKHLIDHYQRHASEGDCQLRLYADIKLLDESVIIKIEDRFIEDPIQFMNPEFMRASYKINFRSIPSRYKLPFLLGDIFPSPEWMKNRYKCGRAKAILYYPQRIGKLGWLI
jgi:hypothetical protein